MSDQRPDRVQELPAESELEHLANVRQLTPETVDLRRYYTLDELLTMPSDVLEELWLACPERPFYEAALRQAVDDTFGAGEVVSDIERLSVIDECLQYYTGQHPDLPSPAPRIPAAQKPDGSVRWFKVSDRIRERLQAGLPVEDARPVEQQPGVALRRVLPIAALGLTVLCLAFAILRSVIGGAPASEADLTATAAAATAQARLPHETPTPTPLALENIDRPIRAGDDLRDYYPVLLELVPAGRPSRVFPVQQRQVEVAEWQYDGDPDVASAVLGLVVRPVLGIPYTGDNAAFLGALAEGDEIRLRMSTGQTLVFHVTGAERVSRQEVAIFDQSQPGIVVVLLDDTAPDRLVIYGRYAADRESPISVASGQSDLTPEGVAAALGNLSITVLGTTGSTGLPGALLPEEWLYLLVDLNIEAAGPTGTGNLLFELLDGAGTRYVPVAAEGALLSYTPFQPVSLAAGQVYRATLAFLVPRDLVAPKLHVVSDGEALGFGLAYELPGALNASLLDVVILAMKTGGTQTDPGDLVVTARLFNPHQSAITVLASDIFVVFSPVALDDAFPVGPSVSVNNGLLPLTIRPGEAADVDLRFDWNGDPFVGLQIGGCQFIAVLR